MSLWALKCTCDLLPVLAFLLSFSPSLGEGVDSSQSSEQNGGEAGGGDEKEKEKEKVEEHNDSTRVRIPMEVAEGSGKLSVYLHKREDQKASDIIRPLLRSVLLCVHAHVRVLMCVHAHVCVLVCARSRVCTHVCTLTCVYSCVCTLTCVYSCVHVHVCVLVCVHTNMCVRVCDVHETSLVPTPAKTQSSSDHPL